MKIKKCYSPEKKNKHLHFISLRTKSKGRFKKQLIYFSALLLFCIIFHTDATAQKYTVSGYLNDEISGESLIGATVYDAKHKLGTTTNLYGFYSITLPKDSIDLIFSFVGYSPIRNSFFLNENKTMTIKLGTNANLKTVEIVAEEKIEERSRMSTIEIPIAQIKAIPALLGETDVLKVLSLLPGIKSGGEGSSGLYVRGGGPDQNLILLDGVPVYNASHLFGFFSVFNADALKNVEVTKGGFPARYGGRLSSVIDLSMKEGNMNKYNVEGSVGIVASRIMIEGPIIKNKMSFMVTGRRTYIDLLARPLIKKYSEGAATFGYYFYDLNAKINYNINEKNHLYLSMYSGEDKFYASFTDKYSDGINSYTDKIKFGLGWGNITTALRYNRVINSKLFNNTRVTYTRYRFYTAVEQEAENIYNGVKDKSSFKLKYLSGINDWSGKTDFDYIPNPNHYVKFGGGYIYHTFNTGALQYKIADSSFGLDTTLNDKKIYGNEFSSYVEDDYKISNAIKVNYGLHYSAFIVNNRTYKSLQPRISARYLLPSNWSVKASYASMTQYLHLLTNSNIGLPTDLWVPATGKIKPQQSFQPAIGIAKTVFENKYEFSIEAYYKKMKNIIDYLDGSSFLNSSTGWEDKVAQGTGWSYGAEFFIQKKKGNVTGWIGYTLSWTNRQFAEINNGKIYPYKYDRRHDLSFVYNHKIDKRTDFNVTWVFGTGNAISLPLQTYSSTAENIPFNNAGYYSNAIYYGDKNSYRMKAYHRLDIGFNFHKAKKWGEASWNFGFYNAYNRKNPYFIYLSQDQNGTPVAKQVSLFPVIPSISYTFKIFKNEDYKK